jgi:ubiquinone biosynthesis protein
VLLRLFETARRFNMEVQPQLILLQKTLLNIEGLGRDLYPELDLFETAAPILRRWMDERIGRRAVLNDLRTQWPEVRETLRELPTLVRRIGEQTATGELKVRFQSPDVVQLREEIRRQNRRRYFATVGLAASIAGVVVLTTTAAMTPGWSLVGGGVLVAMLARPK